MIPQPVLIAVVVVLALGLFSTGGYIVVDKIVESRVAELKNGENNIATTTSIELVEAITSTETPITTEDKKVLKSSSEAESAVVTPTSAEKLKSVPPPGAIYSQSGDFYSLPTASTAFCNGYEWGKIDCPNGMLWHYPVGKKYENGRPQNAYCATDVVVCDTKVWSHCPAGQTFSCSATGIASCINTQKTNPVTTVTTPDYRFQAISRIETLISVYNSYVSWLSSTSEQFRYVANTLAGYPSVGGLVGELRTVSIEICNKQVLVLSALASEANKKIATFKSVQGLIQSKPNESIDLATYNTIPDPALVEADIKSVKNEITVDLTQVMEALQYH